MKEVLLGSYTSEQMIAIMILTVIGQIGWLLLMDAPNRDKYSNRTPINWDWWFFFTDNVRPFFLAMFFSYALAIGGDVLVKWIAGEDMSHVLTDFNGAYISYLIVGLFGQKLAKFIKKKYSLGATD